MTSRHLPLAWTARRLPTRLAGVLGGLLLLGGAVLIGAALWPRQAWSSQELATLRSLSLDSLGPVPTDPSNAVADDPRAAALGQALFFDTRFSANGQVACGTCHQPGRDFTDGLPLAHGVGTTARTTMSLAGTQYNEFLFWDGRKDSQWAQALGPLESAVEHGGSRGQYAHIIERNFRQEYEAVFGPLPDLSQVPDQAGPVEDATARAAWEALPDADRDAVTRVYVNMGKAIAAYERQLLPGPSRFDAYVEDISDGRPSSQLTPDEIAGLRLFIGEANCTTCHNGPLFTNNEFHNNGVPERPGLPADDGRASGAHKVVADEFNCLSRWSDAKPADCTALRFLKVGTHEQERQFKVPSLRNVADRGPYMDAGQFATLREVLEHYNAAPEAPAGHSELKPLHLSETELRQLEAFLRSLSAPLATPTPLLGPAATQSEVATTAAEP
jgi:cytochrome c peroxidase